MMMATCFRTLLWSFLLLGHYSDIHGFSDWVISQDYGIPLYILTINTRTILYSEISDM